MRPDVILLRKALKLFNLTDSALTFTFDYLVFLHKNGSGKKNITGHDLSVIFL